MNLGVDGGCFTYTKWGGIQACDEGDWIVNNNGDCYTINADTFEATYECLALGIYHKVTPVWACKSTIGGYVSTREGRTLYLAGDYVVSNNEDGSDSYAVTAGKFESMYERC